MKSVEQHKQHYTVYYYIVCVNTKRIRSKFRFFSIRCYVLCVCVCASLCFWVIYLCDTNCIDENENISLMLHDAEKKTNTNTHDKKCFLQISYPFRIGVSACSYFGVAL